MCFIFRWDHIQPKIRLRKVQEKSQRWISKVLLRIENGVTIRVSVPPVLVATWGSVGWIFAWLWLVILVIVSPAGYLHTPMFGCLGIFGIFVPTRDLCVFFLCEPIRGFLMVFVWHFLTEIKISRRGFMKFVCLVEQQKHAVFSSHPWGCWNPTIYCQTLPNNQSSEEQLGVWNWTCFFCLNCPIRLKLDWHWSHNMIAAAPPQKITSPCFNGRKKNHLFYRGV